ncbi:OLC1v1001329C1 [Oldenlandia corymbosa var. corymbosa]|uniref:OLC1v1001329C1 n=1 Tax=Oldenlandia corymbosa var. corymbosa TaxID=529605 RepID=A0AAV1D508_OLDCO|nr:OLC1v1001329C1 [Oldenlandia corymbosa var. corymbosa]
MVSAEYSCQICVPPRTKEAVGVEGPVEAAEFRITTTSDNHGSTVQKELSRNRKKFFEDNLIQEDQPVNLLGCISNYHFPNLARNPNSIKMSKRTHSSSEDDSDFSESELDERIDSLYNSLRNGGQEHANGAGCSGKNSMQKRANHLALARYLQDDLAPVPRADDRAEIPLPAVPHAEVVVDPLQSHNPQDRFVYPPMTIVVNLSRKLNCGKFVGHSGRVLHEKYLFEGFNPTKVEPLWDDETGHLGMCIFHFRSGFDGLRDALAFHQAYKNDHHGKQDWEGSVTHNDSLYAWVAQEDDYASTALLGGNFTGVQVSKVSMKSKVSRTPALPLLVECHAYKNDHHGKQDWEGSVTHNDSLYAWVAQEDDYASTRLLGGNFTGV